MKIRTLVALLVMSGLAQAQSSSQTVEGTIKAPNAQGTLLENPIDLSIGVKTASNPDEIYEDPGKTEAVVYEDIAVMEFGAGTSFNLMNNDAFKATYTPKFNMQLMDGDRETSDDIRSFKFTNRLQSVNETESAKTSITFGADYIDAYDYENRGNATKKIVNDRYELSAEAKNTYKVSEKYTMTNAAKLTFKDYFQNYTTDPLRAGQEGDRVDTKIFSNHKFQLMDNLALTAGITYNNRNYLDRVAYKMTAPEPIRISSAAQGLNRNLTWIDTNAGVEFKMLGLTANATYHIQNWDDNRYGAEDQTGEVVETSLAYDYSNISAKLGYSYEVYDYKNIKLQERLSVWSADATIKKPASMPFDVSLNHTRTYERDGDVLGGRYDNIETGAALAFQI